MTAAALDQMGVLLIEDDDGDALLVEHLLAESSLDVRVVRGRTLGEALGRLPGDIDCVLLDLGLPDVVGLDTVTRVCSAAPGIAVIVLTGLDDQAAGEAAVDAGAHDYLVKGKVDGDLLTRAIRYAIGRRHAQEVGQPLRVAELQAAENARLERGLVPHPIVRDPSIWIASSYLPGRRRALLGGDFHDAVETPDGCLHLLVGDVSGHGPDEAALGAGLRIAWRALTLSGASGDLRIEAHRDDGHWELSCTDNWIGIDPEYAERIFVILQRLHSKESYPGTGIGLAMCRKIVEYHGGRIWLDTDHLDGTRIRFTLPTSKEIQP
jgi:DNA-binding NarL/FixJ family response regulator